MSDSTKAISDLCVCCGMCCDGTLFPYAFVRDEDDRQVAQHLGLTTSEIKDRLFFKMPCPHFSGCCTVYDRPRPHTCSAFFCPPIKKYNRGEQTFEDAEQQVTLLRQHRDKLLQIASQFPELENLHFRELRSKLEASGEDEAFVSKYGQLYLMLFIFRDLHSKYFKSAKEDRLII